jgi:alanyl-tRNA synthetase
MALFGEKYGEKVRVVDMEVSKEFCAGTHVYNTSEVMDFEIASVESIGSGVFRVTALTGPNAKELLVETTKNVQATIETIKNKMDELVAKAKAEGIVLENTYKNQELTEKGYRYILALRKLVLNLQNQAKDLEKEYNQKKSQSALKSLSQFDDQIEDGKLFATVSETNTNLIKDMASALLNNKNLSVCFLASIQDSKVTFVCAAKEPYDACNLVKEACKITGGGGGGKKDLAQAGGKDSSLAMDAI